MKGVLHQTLPRSGEAREKLRAKGQFWTPDWVADFMVAYALQEKPNHLLDPALGGGVFFRAAKRFADFNSFPLSLWGYDIDPEVCEMALASGLKKGDLKNVDIRNFILDPPPRKFSAIVANPPYIRHHRISAPEKNALKAFASTAIGRSLDARAGLHVYFFIRTLLALAPGGRLSFIVSADICEGVFSDVLWRWVLSKYRLDAVVSFTPEATPFPGVDTNALVFCLRNDIPAEQFKWIQCAAENAAPLIAELTSQEGGRTALFVQRRTIAEALDTGLSRPARDVAESRYTLGDFASVMRGIVTGDNEFFFMTAARARELNIPDSLLVKAIGRTRDVTGVNFEKSDIVRLEKQGRPTRLLSVNGFSFSELPESVQRYLREGERRGLHKKTLIQTRRPWYKMETRKIPPILFAYLGRRSARFIRNVAGIVPLTSLLCVYPKYEDDAFVAALWRVLSHSDTVANLKKVGKSYGGGAIKVEPRALERLPLPDNILQQEGLAAFAPLEQPVLFG